MGTVQVSYRREKKVKIVPIASEVSSGVVIYDFEPTYRDQEAWLNLTILSSGNIVKTDEADISIVSGVMTISDQGGFALATGDQIFASLATV
jgi:mRNA degradation ribonuclease J1/J2